MKYSDSTKNAVIDAYRDHLSRRYTTENIYRFEDLRVFPEGKIKQIRDFFLTHLYPASAERKKLDEAFENLGKILRSPRKLMPLVGTAFSSIWKLGSLIPAAISGGLSTLQMYLEIRRLETTMMKNWQEKGLDPVMLSSEKEFAAIIAGISDSEVQRFRRDMIKLFDSLANTKLLTATVDILEHSMKVMRSKEGVYSEDEMVGINIGYDLLTGGLSLFLQLNPQEVHLLQSGVDRIEMDWIDRMRKTAKADPV